MRKNPRDYQPYVVLTVNVSSTVDLRSLTLSTPEAFSYKAAFVPIALPTHTCGHAQCRRLFVAQGPTRGRVRRTLFGTTTNFGFFGQNTICRVAVKGGLTVLVDIAYYTVSALTKCFCWGCTWPTVHTRDTNTQFYTPLSHLLLPVRNHMLLWLWLGSDIVTELCPPPGTRPKPSISLMLRRFVCFAPVYCIPSPTLILYRWGLNWAKIFLTAST